MYALRHPERVTRLGSLWRLRTRRQQAFARRKGEADRNGNAHAHRLGCQRRRLSAVVHVPNDARSNEGTSGSINELQRRTTSPDCAVRYFDTVGDFDIVDLPPGVRVPTLVLHVRDDLQQPFEAGQQIAAGIPRARFIALQGQNHMLLPGEPAGVRLLEELELFLARELRLAVEPIIEVVTAIGLDIAELAFTCTTHRRDRQCGHPRLLNVRFWRAPW